MIWIVALVALVLVSSFALLRRGVRWGSTPEERARKLPGDDYLDEGGSAARVAMTRAISIAAPPDDVWPWISQLGRGAGWYSVDWLDNGRKTSARHVVSWIPEPRLGDATAIGYLREIDPGRALVWWVDGATFFGSRARLITCFCLVPEGQGTRLISRMSADASGALAQLALFVFRIIDSIMATRQLLGIRERVEACGSHPAGPQDRETGLHDPETGARDQYQHYEILYARGESAGVAGSEHGARWRQAAIEDEFLQPEKEPTSGET